MYIYYNNRISTNEELIGGHNVLEQVFIPKKTNQICTFDNSRPITITSPIYKILDSILNARLWKELKEGKNSKINAQQTGFRAAIGTEVNILRIIGQIQHNRKQKGKEDIWTLFMDLKSAFDKVDHRILMKKLRDMSISEELVNTIEWLYS